MKKVNSQDPSQHKDGIKELQQVLRQFKRQDEDYNKTDIRLLCGIYDEKVEDLDSDDGIPDGIDISQETEKMPELFKNTSSKRTPAHQSPQDRLLQFD